MDSTGWTQPKLQLVGKDDATRGEDDKRERKTKNLNNRRSHNNKGEGGDSRKQHRALIKSHSSNQKMTAAAAAVVVYASIRGGIKAFHLTRRCFLRQLLVDVNGALKALTLVHWLDFGSLLGIYRDGDLIPHDNDIDLAVMDPNWNELEHKLKKQIPNYNIALLTPSEDPSTRFMRVYCPLAFADVFGATVNDDKLIVDCGHGDLTSVSADLILPTASYEWRGTEIAVPARLEEHLEQRYGETWRTPIYMDKGADEVEHNKTYAKIFRALSKWVGIRL